MPTHALCVAAQTNLTRGTSMCEPTTIALLATSVIGGLAAKNSSDAAVMAQAEATNANTRETYRVAQENERESEARAFEATTDRSRAAQRQLSLARVIAAEGGGSLASRAINISAGAAEDESRIQAGLRNMRSSVRGAMAAASNQNDAAMAEASASLKANQMRFLTQVGSAAISAGAREYDQSNQRIIAENHTPEWLRKQRAFAWATGTKGMAD